MDSRGYIKGNFGKNPKQYWSYNKIKGYIIEQAFLDAFNYTRNTKNNNYGSRPDAITNVEKHERVIKRGNKGQSVSVDTEYFVGSVIIEVKSTRNIKWNSQIKGHMMQAALATNEENEYAGDEGAAVLVIVTLAGTSIDDQVIKKAEKHNIMVVQIQASFNPETGQIGFSQPEVITDNSGFFETGELEGNNVKTVLSKEWDLGFSDQIPALPNWEDAEKNAGFLTNEEDYE